MFVPDTAARSPYFLIRRPGRRAASSAGRAARRGLSWSARGTAESAEPVYPSESAAASEHRDRGGVIQASVDSVTQSYKSLGGPVWKP
jgi:hypothetical protein